MAHVLNVDGHQLLHIIVGRQISPPKQAIGLCADGLWVARAVLGGPRSVLFGFGDERIRSAVRNYVVHSLEVRRLLARIVALVVAEVMFTQYPPPRLH